MNRRNALKVGLAGCIIPFLPSFKVETREERILKELPKYRFKIDPLKKRCGSIAFRAADDDEDIIDSILYHLGESDKFHFTIKTIELDYFPENRIDESIRVKVII
jgi:hypothetical protein